MSRTYRVRHTTSYVYSAEVTDGYSVTRLLPRSTASQEVISAELHMSPDADEYDEREDGFGNRVVQLGIHRPHRSLDITCTSTVRVAPQEVPASDIAWEQAARWTDELSGPTALAVGPMLARTGSIAIVDRGAELEDLTRRVFTPERPLVEACADLCGTIFREFTFDPAATDWTTPLDDVLAHRGGVCQDFAHLAIAACRSRGIAARYVSGYIETDPPPGEVKSIGADASHAWCAVWIPGGGWLDIDPTNDMCPPDRHVTAAWGRDYGDVAPVRGVVIGPNTWQTMQVAVDVHRLAGQDGWQDG